MSVQDEEIVAEFEEIAAAHSDDHVVMEDEPEADDEDLDDEEDEEDEDYGLVITVIPAEALAQSGDLGGLHGKGSRIG